MLHTLVLFRIWIWVSHKQVHLIQAYLNDSYEYEQTFYAKAMIPHALIEDNLLKND